MYPKGFKFFLKLIKQLKLFKTLENKLVPAIYSRKFYLLANKKLDEGASSTSFLILVILVFLVPNVSYSVSYYF